MVMSNTRIQEQFLTDPRYALAKALQSNSTSTAPAQGGVGEALARALGGAISGYQTGKLMKEYKGRDEEARATLSKALDPNLSREERLSALRGVPGYEETAVKASLETPDFDLKGTAEQALFKQAAGQALTPQETAALSAFDQLRQSERMYDPRQNIVPKYGSLMSQQVPAVSSPAAGAQMPPPPMEMPQGGLLPPPSGNGAPDMALMAPATGGAAPSPTTTLPPPPEGLDARARGQYMDTLATQSAQGAVERAGNNGLPKMTETQQQAASRSSLISNGLQQLSSVMEDPAVSPFRMAAAETAEALGPIGSVLGNQIRSPEEQRLIAGRDAAIEGFASAVTGAGVTQDQFTRFSRLLPQGSEDPAVRREKLANAYDFLLTQTKIAGPIANDIRTEVERLRTELQPQQASGGLTPEEQAEYEQLRKMFEGR